MRRRGRMKEERESQRLGANNRGTRVVMRRNCAVVDTVVPPPPSPLPFPPILIIDEDVWSVKTVHRKRRRTSVRENREFDRKRDYNQALSLSVCVKFSIRSGLIIEAGSKGTVDNHPSVPRLDSTRSPSFPEESSRSLRCLRRCIRARISLIDSIRVGRNFNRGRDRGIPLGPKYV